MNALVRFNKGVLKMPIYVQLWLMLLVALNMIVPLFFLARLEAILVLAAAMAGMIAQTVVTAYSGFTRLLGLGHIFWFPLLYFIWIRLDMIPADDFFGIWIRVLMTLNALSLVIDVIDVIRYATGDREETVKGL